MQRKIYHSLQIVVTESWTVLWENAAFSPSEPGSQVIVWGEEEPAPETVVLRRSADGSGWQISSHTAKE